MIGIGKYIPKIEITNKWLSKKRSLLDENIE
jgi:hypothetical protein